jgi:plasmid stability protein
MKLKIDLPDDQTAALTAKARVKGLSAEQYVREVLEHDLASDSKPRPIWEVIEENMKRVPREDMAILRSDGAS